MYQTVKKVKGKKLTSPILLCTVLAEEGLSATYLSKFLTELFSATLLNLEYLSKVPCENQQT